MKEFIEKGPELLQAEKPHLAPLLAPLGGGSYQDMVTQLPRIATALAPAITEEIGNGALTGAPVQTLIAGMSASDKASLGLKGSSQNQEKQIKALANSEKGRIELYKVLSYIPDTLYKVSLSSTKLADYLKDETSKKEAKKQEEASKEAEKMTIKSADVFARSFKHLFEMVADPIGEIRNYLVTKGLVRSEADQVKEASKWLKEPGRKEQWGKEAEEALGNANKFGAMEEKKLIEQLKDENLTPKQKEEKEARLKEIQDAREQRKKDIQNNLNLLQNTNPNDLKTKAQYAQIHNASMELKSWSKNDAASNYLDANLKPQLKRPNSQNYTPEVFEKIEQTVRDVRFLSQNRRFDPNRVNLAAQETTTNMQGLSQSDATLGFLRGVGSPLIKRGTGKNIEGYQNISQNLARNFPTSVLEHLGARLEKSGDQNRIVYNSTVINNAAFIDQATKSGVTVSKESVPSSAPSPKLSKPSDSMGKI
jgi:hypothetical protein